MSAHLERLRLAARAGSCALMIRALGAGMVELGFESSSDGPDRTRVAVLAPGARAELGRSLRLLAEPTGAELVFVVRASSGGRLEAGRRGRAVICRVADRPEAVIELEPPEAVALASLLETVF